MAIGVKPLSRQQHWFVTQFFLSLFQDLIIPLTKIQIIFLDSDLDRFRKHGGDADMGAFFAIEQSRHHEKSPEGG